jgi:hypothetical protein
MLLVAAEQEEQVDQVDAVVVLAVPDISGLTLILPMAVVVVVVEAFHIVMLPVVGQVVAGLAVMPEVVLHQVLRV